MKIKSFFITGAAVVTVVQLSPNVTEDEKKLWMQGEAIGWALESHTAARDHLYKGLAAADVAIAETYRRFA